MKKIIHVDNAEKLEKALSVLKRKTMVGVDTETNGLDPLVNDVLLIQIGDQTVQYVFDVYQLKDILGPVIAYLNRPDVVKILHNAEFDYMFLKSNFGLNMSNIKCTMLGSILLTKGNVAAKNNLAACLDKYLNVKVSKVEQKSFVGMALGEPFTAGQIEYAGDDVRYMIPLFEHIDRLLQDRDMAELAELEYEAARAIGDLHLNGIFLDSDKWLKLANVMKEQQTEAKKELDAFFIKHCRIDLFGDPVVNYGSPLQVKPLLEKITGESLESTNERDLSRVKHPVIDALLKYREANKRVTTYGESFLNQYVHPKTGRVHSKFKQLGADSGRMASRDPKYVGVYKLGELLETPLLVWGNQQLSRKYTF